MSASVLRPSALSMLAVAALATTASAGTSYTPLTFGPLIDPGNGAYFTNVYDISADGQSYVGVLNTNSARFVAGDNAYTMAGPGGPFGISANGQVAVGGQSGQTPVTWNINDLSGNLIPSTPIPGASEAFLSTPAYGTNANGTTFNFSSPTGILDNTGFKRANDAFTPINPEAFAGANRGMAAFAPIAVVLGHIPGNATNAYRWNYVTGDVSPLQVPANATSITVNGTGTEISGDASYVGGSAAIGGSIASPHYWDADGIGHAIPTVGSRIWGNTLAVNYTGTLMGGNIFGAGMPNHAFLFDRINDVTYDLNDLFADAIPDGWILTQTQHISNDGSRIFAQALAPDGTTRSVLLTGDFNVPTPAATALFLIAGAGATRRRRA